MANIFKCFFPRLLQVFETDSKELWGSWAYRFEETNDVVRVPVPTSNGHRLWFLSGLAEAHCQALRRHCQWLTLSFDSSMILFNVF